MPGSKSRPFPAALKPRGSQKSAGRRRVEAAVGFELDAHGVGRGLTNYGRPTRGLPAGTFLSAWISQDERAWLVRVRKRASYSIVGRTVRVPFGRRRPWSAEVMAEVAAAAAKVVAAANRKAAR